MDRLLTTTPNYSDSPQIRSVPQRGSSRARAAINQLAPGTKRRPPPAGTGEDRQLVTQEQVLGNEVGAFAQTGADGPKEQDDELAQARRTHDPEPVRPLALSQRRIGWNAAVFGSRAGR
jgi:hypothetical protein